MAPPRAPAISFAAHRKEAPWHAATNMIYNRVLMILALVAHVTSAFNVPTYRTATSGTLIRTSDGGPCMADLTIESCGMKFPNPFVIGSGPPGTNYKTIARCFESGWGGVVAKTVSLTDNPVNNVSLSKALLPDMRLTHQDIRMHV